MDGNNDSPKQKPTTPLPPPAEVAPSQQPVVAPGPQSPQPSSRKSLRRWILLGLIGVVIVGGGGVMIVKNLNRIPSEQYHKAFDELSSLSTPEADVVSSFGMKKQEAREKIAAYIKAGEHYFKRFPVTQQRILRNPKIKKAYNEYEAAWRKARPHMDSFVDTFYEPLHQADKLSSSGVCVASKSSLVLPPEGISRAEWAAITSELTRYTKVTETCPQEVAKLKAFNIEAFNTFADAALQHRARGMAFYAHEEGRGPALSEDELRKYKEDFSISKVLDLAYDTFDKFNLRKYRSELDREIKAAHMKS